MNKAAQALGRLARGRRKEKLSELERKRRSVQLALARDKRLNEQQYICNACEFRGNRVAMVEHFNSRMLPVDKWRDYCRTPSQHKPSEKWLKRRGLWVPNTHQNNSTNTH